MGALEDLAAGMKTWRQTRKTPPQGQARYDLNRWLGAERQKLQDEYRRRMAEIESGDWSPDPIPQSLLDLVARAVNDGHSRSMIRVSMGLKDLASTDEIIHQALTGYQAQVESGERKPFMLSATGEKHAKGAPMFAVTIAGTGDTFKSVYLLMNGKVSEPQRHHMRIQPSPAGSKEILDMLWDLGVGQEIFDVMN